MSHFYAYLPPAGRAKTGTGRCGTKGTGQIVSIGSSKGVILVHVWYNDKTKQDEFQITLNDHGGKKDRMVGKPRSILSGRLSDWAFIEALVGDEKKLAEYSSDLV